MKATFPLLGDAAYIDFIGSLGRLGANPTTHIANIRYPVQRAPVASVVKLLPPDGFLACNEAIAWLFLNAAGVQAPKHAALITLSLEKATRVFGKQKVPPGYVSQGFVLAWAAQQLHFGSIQALFAGSTADDKWLNAICTVQGAAIAAFDEAFLNLDRNCGNILHLSASAFIPIDHEMIFGLQPWHVSDLRQIAQDSDTLKRLKTGVLARRVTRMAYDETRSRMAHHARSHALALQACEIEIRALLTQVFANGSDDMARRVLSFVTARTMGEWMADRLGVTG